MTPYCVYLVMKHKLKMHWKASFDPCILEDEWMDHLHFNFLMNPYAPVMNVKNPPYKLKPESLMKSVIELGKGRSSINLIPAW